MACKYLTDNVYLAAPGNREAERAFASRVAELIREYNFPLFFPQEVAREEGMDDPQAFRARCMDELGQAYLVVAIYFGEEFDPHTAFEVGYALGRRINVVALQNTHDTIVARLCDHHHQPVATACHRIVESKPDNESLQDVLIPIMNRYYGPESLLGPKL